MLLLPPLSDLVPRGTGVPTFRRIENRTHDNVAFRVIAENKRPGHESVRDFRKCDLEALAGPLWQNLRLRLEQVLWNLAM